MVFEVFYYSYVPALVSQDALLDANSRLQASESTARIAGPGLAGLLTQLLSAPFALIADVASFVFSAVMLARIRTVEQSPSVDVEQGPISSQIRAGLNLTWRNKILLTLVGTAAICNLTAEWIIVLFPLLCIQVDQLNAGAIGLVIATGAIGSLLGAAICGSITRRIGVGQATLWTLLGECPGFLLIPFAPAHSPLTIATLIVGWFVVGFSAATSRIESISIRQTVTPAEYLGRVNATHRFISYGVVSISTFASGVLASTIGIRAAILTAAALMFASVAWVLTSPLLHIRDVTAQNTLND